MGRGDKVIDLCLAIFVSMFIFVPLLCTLFTKKVRLTDSILIVRSVKQAGQLTGNGV